jgi:TPR repeat protein
MDTTIDQSEIKFITSIRVLWTVYYIGLPIDLILGVHIWLYKHQPLGVFVGVQALTISLACVMAILLFALSRKSRWAKNILFIYFIFGFIGTILMLAFKHATLFEITVYSAGVVLAGINLYCILYISANKQLSAFFHDAGYKAKSWYNYRATIWLTSIFVVSSMTLMSFGLVLAIKTSSGGANADYITGSQYFQGKVKTKNFIKAFYWWKRAANLGYAPAEDNVGVCYSHGFGVPQDFSKALYWYKKAASQGDAFAEMKLGYAYLKGNGVTKNHDTAFSYFNKSAAKGLSDSEAMMGLFYLNGFNVRKNAVVANSWFEKAANQGNLSAECYLADDYYWGTGIGQDPMKALYWWKKAADQGGNLGKKAAHDIKLVEQGSVK